MLGIFLVKTLFTHAYTCLRKAVSQWFGHAPAACIHLAIVIISANRAGHGMNGLMVLATHGTWSLIYSHAQFLTGFEQ